MHAMMKLRSVTDGIDPVRPMAYEDPIGEDGFDDVAVTTTVRGLGRIAMVHASRF